MSLDAARSAALALRAAEGGASSASFLRVGGAAPGARLLLVVASDGAETLDGSLGSPELDAAAREAGRVAVVDPHHVDGTRTLPGDVEVYVEVRRPVQDLVIVGAGHIALPMARTGADLGFRVWVLDDRPDFANRERFFTFFDQIWLIC